MKRTLLIADDSQLDRMILKNCLINEYDVIETENGAEVLKILEEKYQAISVVIIDISMPVMDGFTALKKIRENPAYLDIPVIMITVDNDFEMKRKSIEFGSNGFVSKPYDKTLLLKRIENLVSIRENAALVNVLSKDSLTGMMSTALFFSECDKHLAQHKPGYYVMACIDIDNFKIINDQYGMDIGDQVIKHVAECLSISYKQFEGLACRFYADKFAVLYPVKYADHPLILNTHKHLAMPSCISHPIGIHVGRYIARDLSISANIMFERAAVAEQSLKGRYGVCIAEYTDEMLNRLLKEQQIVNEMEDALKCGEFIPFLQPQYNHSTGALIGAEALVRWKKADRIVFPGEFIPIFEKNGFVYEVDKYIWEEISILLRKWLDEGRSPLPVSVNISRFDLYKDDFMDVICNLIEKYQLPHDLLRLEVTESVFADSPDYIIKIVNQLIDYGFTVEIDDFGSGYSSLNTLKDVPASILKLDMRFFSQTDNDERSGNIIESVVRMATWLDMSVIAEGVEKVEQADFLKSIGCYFIQGYLYAKPMPVEEYERLLETKKTEHKSSNPQTIATLDQNRFWDPESMDTLIFNSYVGGACIFEQYKGEMQLLRVNNQYRQEFGTILMNGTGLERLNLVRYLDEKNLSLFYQTAQEADRTAKEASCEITASGLDGKKEYMDCTLRLIAKAQERNLFYCVISNKSREKEANEQLLFLNEAAHDIMTYSEVDTAINTILKRLRENFSADRTYLVEFDRNKVLDNTYEVDRPGVSPKKNGLKQCTYEDIKIIVSRLDKKSYIFVDNVEKLDSKKVPVKNMLLEDEVHSYVLIPILHGKEIVGIVGIDNPDISFLKLDSLLAVGDYFAILTSRKGMDQTIAQEKEAMHFLMEDTPGGFCRIRICEGKEPEIVYANKGFINLLNMSYDEIMSLYGTSAYHWIHPDDVAFLDAEGKKGIQNGGQFTIKCRLRMKSGTYLDVIILGRFVVINSDEIYLNAHFIDNNQQAKEEAKQKALLDNLPCGAALFEYDGKKLSVVHINKRYWELVKRKPADFDKISVTTFLHPADVEIAMQEVEAAIRQKRDIRCDLRILYSDEGYRPFRVDGSIERISKAKYQIFSTYAPIDKDVMSYQEVLSVALSTMMEASTDLTYVKDKNLRYVCCSRTSAEMLRLQSTRDIIGKTDYDLYEKSIADDNTKKERMMIENGEASINKSMRIPIPGGKIIILNISKYPIKDIRGNVVGIYTLARDISNEQERESQLALLTSTIPGGIAAYIISKTEPVKTIFFNDGLNQLYGYSREEYAEVTMETPLVLVSEEDRGIVDKMIRALINKRIDGDSDGGTYKRRKKDGKCIWINLRCRLTVVDEETSILHVVQMDISGQKEKEQQLLTLEEEYRLTAQHSGRTIARFDVEKRTLTITEEAAQRYLIPKCYQDVPYGRVKTGEISLDTSDTYIRFFENIMKGMLEGDMMFQKRIRDSWRWFSTHSTTLFSEEGKPVSALISLIDVTEQYEKDAIYTKWQQSLENRPDNSYSLFRCVLGHDNLIDMTEGRLIKLNTTEGKSGLFDECFSMYTGNYVYADDCKRFLDTINSVKLKSDFTAGKRRSTLEYREIVSPNEYIWIRRTIDLVERPDSDGVIVYILFEDINKSKRAELETQTLAETDVLTGILNRKAFETRLIKALAERNDNSLIAFFIMDIDEFKLVNDTFGHAMGDQVLKEVAKLLRSALGDDDLIGRLGGDEFIFCMLNVPNKGIIRRKVRRIWNLLHKKLDESMTLSGSIGISVYPEDGSTFDELYKTADKALYLIKENGKNNYGFYHEEIKK